MKDKIRLYAPILYTLTCALLLCEAAVALLRGPYARYAVFAVGGIVALALIISILLVGRANRGIDRFVSETGAKISQLQSDTLIEFPLPIVAASEGAIVWCNTRANEDLFGGEDHFSRPIGDLFGEDLDRRGSFDTRIGEKRFTVYPVRSEESDALVLYYLIDDTRWKETAEQFERTRPSVFLISVDNFDEMQRYARDHDRAQLLMEIERRITEFVNRSHGLSVKTDADRYLAIIEEQYLDEIVQGRFAVLDEVRALSVDQDNLVVSLSIGLARNCRSLPEGENIARQALDMAQGRGGDQAAVKTNSGYDFYGGVSKGVERRTKVKTRIIATALRELILSSDTVVLMGHRYGDYDSFGAAVGLLRAVRQMGRRGLVAIDRSKNLVSDLMAHLEANGYENSFYNPSDALMAVNDAANPLLIILDTHLENVLESPEIYRACRNVVVIDHHRRMVGYIENGVIFYHEPYASSACEMVTELVQYLGEEVGIERTEAEALLAGIMLDTKNFSIRTGVRTFEAAAYLRRRGADTAEVRKLFSSTITDYRERARLVANADVVRRCAVAQMESGAEDARVVAAQAADELLNISGVDASFVLYPTQEGVSISARSMGRVNVQVIMEALGGGGHQTMAATQLSEVTLAEARQKLLEVIEANTGET